MASLQNLIPSDLLSAIVEEDLRRALVFGDVCNRRYEGMIRNAGDSVKIPAIGDVTLATHTVNDAITYETLDSASTTLLIDQMKRFSFRVDDADAAQSLIDASAAYASRAAYQLRDNSDAYIAALHGGAGVVTSLGTTAVPLTVTAAASTGGNIGVLEILGRINQGLDNNNVPTDARWCIVPPWFHQKLVMAELLTTETQVEPLTNGRLGRVMGLDIRMSTQVVNYNTTGSKILAGTMEAISFAEQLLNIETIRLEGAFGTGVRGLYVYGAKVVRAKELACATVSEATG